MTSERADVSALLDKMITLLEGKKRSLEASLEALQTLKTHAQNLPAEMMDAILDSMKSIVGTRRLDRMKQSDTSDSSEAVQADDAENATKPHYQRIVDFFMSRENHPAHNAMIRLATGLSRGAVAIVLYKSRADQFVRVDMPGKPKKVWWKLKDDVFEALKDAEFSTPDEIPF